MDENNFRYFMEFLKFLEAEDMKGSAIKESMEKLLESVLQELTPEQREALERAILPKMP